MTKVAIFVPSFNRPTLIEPMIKSVQAQTMKDWKLYILDNSSPQIRDKLRGTLMNYAKEDNRIKIFYEDTLIHQGVAYNKLMFDYSERDEQYIMFCADDIMLHPRKLEYLTEYLDNHPDHSIICGLWAVINREGGLIEAHGDWTYLDNANCAMNLTQPLIRRSIIDRTGPMEQVIAPLCPDAVYWIHIALRTGAKFYGHRALGEFLGAKYDGKALDVQYPNYVDNWKKIRDSGGWEQGILYE